MWTQVLDGDKQHATNLFLGLYQPKEHPRWWNLESDTQLHFEPFETQFCPGEWSRQPCARSPFDKQWHYFVSLDVGLLPCWYSCKCVKLFLEPRKRVHVSDGRS